VPYGNWRYYHENGTLSMEGRNKEGEKDGFWKLYYPTGEFKAESQFSMGEGPYKEFFESGKMKVVGYIKKGQNEGSWTYYYEDGTLEGHCNFQNGEGKFTGYYQNGMKKMEGTILNGVKVGVWKLYKPRGELAGFYRTYYEEKQPVFIALEDNGDSLKPISKATISSKNKKTDNEGKSYKSSRSFWSRIRYFRPINNEYRTVILGSNPLAMFVYRQLPLFAEYIIEERIGIQFIYIYSKNPFFESSNNLPERIVSSNGHSLEIMQKFYHKNRALGSLYFGHGVRYKNTNFNTSVNDSTSGSKRVFNYELNQQAFEYSIVGGNRIYINGFSDKRMDFGFLFRPYFWQT